MKDQDIGKDCLKLIRMRLEGKITLKDYIAEIELLEVKYLNIGFMKSADDLRKWSKVSPR